MLNSKNYVALGLMSGTSADGVDVGILITDGKTKIKLGPSGYYPFSKSFISKIKSIFKKRLNVNKSKKQKRIIEIENEFTHLNFISINKFLKKNKIDKNKIDVIGFHGQTISHNPDIGYSWQIGNSQNLANLLNIKVVSNFRENDIKNGGQGAPLTPVFHYYLTKKIKKRICFINLGGISNITYFNHKSKTSLNKMVAFDAGPCCSLIDDWISKNSNKKFDNLGLLARNGNVKKEIIQNFLKRSFFSKFPPKSLDRSFFSLSLLKKLKIKDGAATLTYLAADTLSKAFDYFPKNPDLCILSGGGRHNKFLVELLNKKIKKSKILLTENYNWNGDSIEAHAFAYLSVRKLLNLPITFPLTTGIKQPLTGGKIFTFI
jgi:anhydro-N-acetylmuramic acid kinase